MSGTPTPTRGNDTTRSNDTTRNNDKKTEIEDKRQTRMKRFGIVEYVNDVETFINEKGRVRRNQIGKQKIETWKLKDPFRETKKPSQGEKSSAIRSNLRAKMGLPARPRTQLQERGNAQ
jgi:hypothetical protein